MKPLAALSVFAISAALALPATANAAPASDLQNAPIQQVQAAAVSATSDEYYRLHPIRQSGTGEASGNNCGPTSLVMSVYALGKTPTHWDPSNGYEAEVEHMRYTAMNETGSTTGTNSTQIKAGFSYYGYSSTSVSGSSAFGAVTTAAKEDRISVLGGGTGGLHKFYGTDGRNYSHWLVVAGYNDATSKYLVMDPAAPSAKVYEMSEATLKAYHVAQPDGILIAVTTSAKRPAGSVGPRAAAISGYGDFTGDGKYDILGYKPGTSNGQLVLYPGTGTLGGYGNATTFGSSWNQFNAVLRSDFDGDNKTDIIGRKPDGLLYFYKGLGNATGGVNSQVKVEGTTGWGQFTQLAAPGDMNKNGTDDILGVKADGSLIFYDGTDAPGVDTGVTIDTGWNQYTKIVTLGDINNDTVPDIAGITTTGDLQLYTGNGDGDITKKTVIGQGWDMYDGKVTNLGPNGDAHPDLGAINATKEGGQLAIWRGANDITEPYLDDPNIGAGWNTYAGLF